MSKSAGDLSYEDLTVAFKIIGYDLTCAQCACVFYTGSGSYPHDVSCSTKSLFEVKTGAIRERLPDTRDGVTRKFKIARPDHPSGDLRMYVTVGLYPDGRPGEIFIKSDRTGSFASGALDAVALTLSMAWQHGVPFEPTVRKLLGMRFEPQGYTGDPKYPLVKSPLDYVAKWLLDRFGKKESTGE